jgi:adenosylhomocysteine nucleosidase
MKAGLLNSAQKPAPLSLACTGQRPAPTRSALRCEAGVSELPTRTNVAIVAALEREVRPFIKNWPTTRKEYGGRVFKFFEKEQTVVVCGGMGSEAARRAAEAVISLYHPAVVISAGFAGALDSSLHVGHTLIPGRVVDAGDGSRTDLAGGEGVLVTFDTIADAAQKARLAKAYGARAVDMEASAVARAAEAHRVRFVACKVISDTSESHLPPISRFIGTSGQFQVSEFVGFVAIRPWLWGSVLRLARDSERAAAKLAEALADIRRRTLAESEARAEGLTVL